MDWNEEMLEKWQKVDLENGNIIYLRERKNEEVDEIKLPKIEVAENKRIHVRKKNVKPILGTTTIILTDNDKKFLGLCEFRIKDGEAALSTRDVNEYNNMDLPEELEKARKDIEDNLDAIFVNKNMKNTGLGTQLLIIGFNYLKRKGIDTVTVAAAIDSRKFYEKTGADFNSSTDIFYTNLSEKIEKLTVKLKEKERKENAKESEIEK